MLKKILLVLSLLLTCTGSMIAQGTASADSTPAKTAEPAKKTVFRSTKDQVTAAQALLKGKKLFNGEATGVSSAEWKTALKTYQGDNGLAKTGSLNRATLEKMEIKLTDKQKDIPVDPKHLASGETKPGKSDKPSTSSTGKVESMPSDGAKRPAPFQANKDQITALQTKLKEAKLFTGDANGDRSDVLKDAVKKYQESNGLKSTGGINAATLEKAGIALTGKQKEQVAAQAAYDASKKN